MSELNRYFGWIEDDWGQAVTETVEVFAENDEQARSMISSYDFQDPWEDAYEEDDECELYPVVVPANRCSNQRILELEEQLREG